MFIFCVVGCEVEVHKYDINIQGTRSYGISPKALNLKTGESNIIFNGVNSREGNQALYRMNEMGWLKTSVYLQIGDKIIIPNPKVCNPGKKTYLL